MSLGDAERWQARWLARGDGPAGAPESYLLRQAHLLPPGLVLDVAAGDGRNGLWLARQGRAVTAVDIASAAIVRLAARAQAEGLALTTRVADLDTAEALAGLGPFAVLVIVRYRPPPRQWPALLAAMAPGARLLFCSFAMVQHERRGMRAAFCLDRATLAAELAPGLRLLDWQEHEEEGDSLAGSLWERLPAS